MNYSIRQKAEEFGVTVQYAVGCRQRYLQDRITEAQKIRDECINWPHGDEDEKELMAEYSIAAILTINRRKKKLQTLRAAMNASKDQITDDMVERARNYPIDQLIEFGRAGKMACPFHDDKNPSAYHGTRSNRLVCPVCNKTWSALDILMQRDGMSFRDAVITLA